VGNASFPNSTAAGAIPTFDEGITDEGVLSWQSQPRQSLDDPRVLQWISHDEFLSNIYLFLRTSGNRKYAYLGRLKYLDHDRELERPVYFQWQILDWSISRERQAELGIQLHSVAREHPVLPQNSEPGNVPGEIIEVDPPAKAKVRGQTTLQFRGRKRPDYSLKDAADRRLGYAGEIAVLAKEKQHLASIGRKDLAEKVVHVSEIEGDGAGYDIRSFDADGEIRYIEVKTTRGNISTPFFMAVNEVKFAELHQKQYTLFRLFDFEIGTKSGRVFRIEGNIKEALQFEAINYRVRA
jgi:hypothetical protein